MSINTYPTPITETTISGTVATDTQRTAFGEQSVAIPTPEIQLQFPYNIDPEQVGVCENASGTVTVDNRRAAVSTGASTNSSARMYSIIPVKYNTGQGGLVRFTGVYTAGATGSTQYIGVGDSSDGYFVGYNGSTFGVMRRSGGTPEIRTLTVTTGSSTAENITITLDGDGDTTVAVTNTGDTTLTANEIADNDFSDIGTGWKAVYVGSKVVFTSFDATTHTGSYSLSSATTAVGTFAQTIAGAAPTETVVTQANWSDDVMDGTGSSGVTLDQTKGNIFQIRYQWLGYGMIIFGMENPSTGKIIDVHKIQYANANTLTSVQNPTLPLWVESINTTNNTDIVVKSPSMAGFVEGKKIEHHNHHGAVVSATSIGTTETPVLTIRVKEVFQSTVNRVRVKLVYAGSSVDGTKPAIVRFRVGAVLTGASFSDVSTNSSVVEVDSSATATSNGSLQYAYGLSKAGTENLSLASSTFFLGPSDTISISVEASSWIE